MKEARTGVERLGRGALGMESMAAGKKQQQITLIKRKLVCKSSVREDRWEGERGGGGA